MKMVFEMPCVQTCAVSECTYNHDGKCHARAVTIGDGNNPGCDTFFSCGKHCHSEALAGVGACKVNGCMHNVDFECQAENISVGIGTHGKAVCKSCRFC